MRASKKGVGRNNKPGTDMHISGAECICDKAALSRTSGLLIKRALTHPRGNPDTVVITLEEINQKPKIVSLLNLTKVKCSSPEQAAKIIAEQITTLGISRQAIAAAMKILRSGNSLRGAVLISALSGKRLDPDKKRGVRVSRLDISPASEKKLSATLSVLKINTPTVKEALTLASKVASCKGIIAEICISDDPHYTTGYIASKKTGYLRLPNIKKAGEMSGGRVFFVADEAPIAEIIEYLQKKPVLAEYK
jgi:6-carboxyhexanoate--CoA ligase